MYAYTLEPNDTFVVKAHIYDKNGQILPLSWLEFRKLTFQLNNVFEKPSSKRKEKLERLLSKLQKHKSPYKVVITKTYCLETENELCMQVDREQDEIFIF